MNVPLPQRQQRNTTTTTIRRQVTTQQRERRRERRRNQRARKRQRIASSLSGNIALQQGVYPLPGSADTGLRRLQRVRMVQGEKITMQGLSFLKCAFAPPDFSSNDIAGVPDEFHGTSLTKKHRLISPITLAASQDLYILFLPTPGIAYWTASVVPGAGVTAATGFNPVYYSDSVTMFGNASTAADIVTKFRYVSNHIEIVPTVNQMQWTGNIQCWKAPIATFVREGGANSSDMLSISGIRACTSTNANQYTGPFNLGVYSGAYNANAKFDFQPIMEGIGNIPGSLTASDFGFLASAASGFYGLDNEFESIIIKISGVGVNANNTAIVKTWACVEYQCVPGNLLYEFSSLSPTDAFAIRVYREIINNLPVGVSFTQNDSFWQRVLRIIKAISGGLSVLPGPYGSVATGVNMISSGIESLVL